MRPTQQHFQSIIDLLLIIRSKINNSTNVGSTHFDTPGELVFDLDELITKLKQHGENALREVKLNFAPTSTYQELSISNDWDEDYLLLSKKFDALYKQLTSSDPLLPGESSKKS